MKGFQKGDPRARSAGKKAAAGTARTRRQQMWARFEATCQDRSAFECFVLGWRAHRIWSARRRFQVKQATEAA